VLSGRAGSLNKLKVFSVVDDISSSAKNTVK